MRAAVAPNLTGAPPHELSQRPSVRCSRCRERSTVGGPSKRRTVARDWPMTMTGVMSPCAHNERTLFGGLG
jgi:hypothetical protein